jgi:GT2 family glycosyltransferase
MIDFVLINYHCSDDVGRIIGQISRTIGERFTITVIDNSYDNRGFSQAANIGASYGHADIIAFLNPDIHLVTGWADETLKAMAADSNLAISGPRLDDGMDWPRDVSRNGIKNWVCGACFFVRRDFFESRGGFDERFFFTYEETDLIRRAEMGGFSVMAQNQDNPRIKHIRHNTPFHDEQLRKGYDLYYEKWGD